MQIVDHGVIKLYNFGAAELLARHTGDNLKKVILKTIGKFDITASNIYSIRTDNGANIVKAVKLMSNSVENENMEVVDDEEEMMNDLELIQSEVLLDTLLELNWDDLAVLSKYSSIYNFLFDPSKCILFHFFLLSVDKRCCAHTLHLAIMDLFKIEAPQNDDCV